MIYDILLKPKATDGKKILEYLLHAPAQALIDFEDINEELKNELNPFKTNKLLPEWEREVGIPDDCIPLANTVEERRANMLFKLFAINIEAPIDIINLANQLNLKIEVQTAFDRTVYPALYPIPYISDTALLFTFFIKYLELANAENTYPALYPFLYSVEDNVKAFECLVLKSMPPNYVVAFEKALPPPPPPPILPSFLAIDDNTLLALDDTTLLTF